MATQVKESVRSMYKNMIGERENDMKSNKRQKPVIRRVNFDKGDYVLRSKEEQKHYDKVLISRIGPYQIIGANSHSFKVNRWVAVEETDVFHPIWSSMLTAFSRSRQRLGSKSPQGLVSVAAAWKTVDGAKKESFRDSGVMKGPRTDRRLMGINEITGKGYFALVYHFVEEINDTKL